MPMGTQAKLLKVLEEMTFRRLGGTRDLTVSVRVVAATNKDLADEVERGAFRLDLYHRLDVFHVRVPPLRERREDILPLATHFLARFAARMRKPAARFAPETERALARLRLSRQRARAAQRHRAGGDPVDPGSDWRRLHRDLRTFAMGAGSAAPPSFFSIDVDGGGKPPDLEALERAYIARLLTFAGGNRTAVARLLGVSYPTIAKKIADYGLA